MTSMQRNARLHLFSALALLMALLVAPNATAETPAETPGPFQHVRVVDFPGPIAALLAAYVDRQATAAEEDGVDCLVLRIESPGGTVLHSMEIGDRLLSLPDSIHVVAWIPKYAYSGAAMVTLSCDEIVMGPDAHLGDSQPIIPSAEGIPKPVGEKAETVLRAKFRAYAERNGYPVPLAAAMVSERIEVLRVRDPQGNVHFVRGEDFKDAKDDAVLVPGWTKKDLVQDGPAIVREGELLTMTAQEAQRFGFLRRTFEDGQSFPDDEEALLATLKTKDATVERIGLTFSETASRWLLKMAGVLSALVALAVMLTLFRGIGTITIIGGIALALVILINATADQLNGFPLFLIAVGALLLAAEVFVIPGFGVAGILGIAALGSGFLFLALGMSPADPGSFDFDQDHAQQAIDFGLQFVVTILGGIFLVVLFARWFPTIGPGRHMLLGAPGVGEITHAPERIRAQVPVGTRGVAASSLRPTGSAELDGRQVDVLTAGEFLDPGTKIEVIAVEGNLVTARAVDEAESI